jgi:hypothetical protein
VELQPHGIGGERAARQPCPLRSVLAFLDPLLGGAASVVEGNDALGRSDRPSRRSIPRSNKTPASDDSMPPSNPTLTFLRATAGNSNGRILSSSMTDLTLLDRDWPLLWQTQNHRLNQRCTESLGPARTGERGHRAEASIG